MEDHNVPVLVDAKAEYTMQMITILLPHLYTGIRRIYIDAKAKSDEDNEPENILMNFQNLLSSIPKWNQEIVTDEYKIIVEESDCDYLEDLLTAIIVSHTKVLTAIRVGNLQKKINIKIPKIENFIHKTYIQLAREFWKNPYLFDDDSISKIEYQRNIRDCEKIISEGIQETIRKQLPVKHILKEYLGDSYEEECDEDISKNVSEQEMNNIKKMIKSEFEEYSRNNENSENKESISNTELSINNIDSIEKDILNSEINNSETEIKIDNIREEIDLEKSDSELKVEDIDSDLKIDTINNEQFSKPISEFKIEDLESDLKFENLDNDLKIDNVDNDLKIDNVDNDLKIDNVDNDLKIDNVDNDLKIDNVYNDLKIDNVDNDLKIENLENIAANIHINNDTISLDKIETPQQSNYIPISEEKKKSDNLSDILFGDNSNMGELVIDDAGDDNNLKINDIDNTETSIKNEVLNEFKNLNPENIKTIHIDEPEDPKKKKKKISLFDDATDMSDDIIANNVQILN